MSPNAGNSLSGNEIMDDFVVFFVISPFTPSLLLPPPPKLSAWKNIMPCFYDALNFEMPCQLDSIVSEERRKSYHMKL